MQTYEFTFLVADEKDAAKVKKTLKEANGSVIAEKAWGKRSLAYPINKNTEGYYFTWNIKIEKADIATFKSKLSFSELFARYLLLQNETMIDNSAKE